MKTITRLKELVDRFSEFFENPIKFTVLFVASTVIMMVIVTTYCHYRFGPLQPLE